MSSLSSFGALDELIQLIHQGRHRFVLLSSVDYEQWTCKLGMIGSEGRWWSGSWNEKDITAVLGSKLSETLLEKFAGKLAESLIKGDVFIAGCNPTPTESMKLTFSPGSKKPMNMELSEMSAVDAAAFASEVFLQIAMRAKDRQCQLFPANYMAPSSTTTVPAASSSKALPPKQASSDEDVPKESSTKSKKPVDTGKRKLKEASPEPEPKTKAKPTTAASRAMKGASLANPNKKARKYQAIEFGSDGE